MRAAYEHRPQQMQMAEAVEKALAAKTHLIVEAGTGVGKSLAYLVPLVLWTREENCRAVVATYTKALQQQLVQKDLPFLRTVLGDFRYALCVGGENYLCLRRFDQLRMGDLYEQNEREALNRLFAWSTMTRTGLRSELDVEPASALWAKACRQADLCFGKDCSFYRDCFYLKAKAIEQQAQILVANHHLFFADMATGGNVLPAVQGRGLRRGAPGRGRGHGLPRRGDHELLGPLSPRYAPEPAHAQRPAHAPHRRRTPRCRSLRGMVDGLRVISDNFFLNLHPFLHKEPALRIRQRNIVPDILSDPLTGTEGRAPRAQGRDPGRGARGQGLCRTAPSPWRPRSG